ncbi:MAG: hypothetical protein IJ880_04085, partial [Bacilli bacterium]|nr:hypothetical protein [Bacilli bacterium]
YKGTIYVIGYYYKDYDDIYLVKGIKELNNLYKNKKVVFIYSKKLQNNNKYYLNNPNNNYPNIEGYKLIELKLLKKLEK